MGAIKKAGVQFFAKIDTNRDLIGAATQFSAEVVVDADGSILTDASANASIGAFVEVGSTGIYRAPVTLTDEGDYTISVKWTDGTDTEYIPFPVEVKAADMSDIKALIDALQGDVTSVKTQVDVLDEASLNGIEASVATLNTNVSTIEAMLDGDDNASLNVLKTLIEDISGSGLGAISEFVDNLELMLEGKAYVDTNGVAVTADDSKGLIEIFNAIVANGTDIATANAAIADLDADVVAFKTSVEGKIADLDAVVDAFQLSVEGKVDAVKTVVDANSSVLTDAAFGNSALKDLIDNLDGDLVSALAGMNTRFDTVDAANTANTTTITDAIASLDTVVDTANADIQALINAQTATLEGRFDSVDSALSNISGAQQYKGFV